MTRTMIHAEVRPDAQKLEDGRLLCRLRYFTAISGTFKQRRQGLWQQSLPKRGLLLDCVEETAREQDQSEVRRRRRTKRRSAPSRTRRSLASDCAVCSISVHCWAWSLTGRLAKRSPSLDEARKALLTVPFMVVVVSSRLRRRQGWSRHEAEIAMKAQVDSDSGSAADDRPAAQLMTVQEELMSLMEPCCLLPRHDEQILFWNARGSSFSRGYRAACGRRRGTREKAEVRSQTMPRTYAVGGHVGVTLPMAPV